MTYIAYGSGDEQTTKKAMKFRYRSKRASLLEGAELRKFGDEIIESFVAASTFFGPPLGPQAPAK
jgi:hypothetical protein